jgi:hypothetical protein
MRYLLLFFVFSALISRGGGHHYLFSYFKDNGEDGLHLAYSNDGLQWKELKGGKSFLQPTAGEDKLMRDPYILQGEDGTFHMVWTCSWKERQIGYASSKDLINWSEQKTIPVMMHEPAARNCWAPEIVYDPQQKYYLVFWATTIPGRHTEVAGSESEKGLNHRMYCTTTVDFQYFTNTRMFFNPDFSVIDATILREGKNWYMFLKNENPNPPEKNIRITSSGMASGPFPVSVSPPITGEYWAEGPSALKIDDYVYVYFDRYREHRYGAVRSKNMKDWEEVSGTIVFPPGVRHGSAFKVSKKLVNSLIQLK